MGMGIERCIAREPFADRLQHQNPVDKKVAIGRDAPGIGIEPVKRRIHLLVDCRVGAVVVPHEECEQADGGCQHKAPEPRVQARLESMAAVGSRQKALSMECGGEKARIFRCHTVRRRLCLGDVRGSAEKALSGNLA